jgi:hypothetical protein
MVESADATEVIARMKVCKNEGNKIDGKAGTLTKVSYVRPSVPDMTSTYQFIVIYQDDTMEIFRGASAKGSFAITKSGKGEIDFEVQAAEVQSVDYDSHLPIKYDAGFTGTITTEAAYNPIVFDFQTSQVYDFVNSEEKIDFPYQLNINFGNTIEPINKTGCLNNIGGWYIKPSITADVDWERTENNLTLYTKFYEGNSNGMFFTSNADFGFYAPFAKFTNVDAKSIDSYDSLHCILNVNSWINSEPLLILPL